MPLFRRRRVVFPVPTSAAEFEYEMVTLRELEQDSMTWQTPGLALTAQAFLLTIALSSDYETSPRVVAALLGILVSALSFNLMWKHVQLAELDRNRMEVLEKDIGIPGVVRRAWAPPPTTTRSSAQDVAAPAAPPARKKRVKKPPKKHATVRFWTTGLIVFTLANCGAIVFAVFDALGIRT